MQMERKDRELTKIEESALAKAIDMARRTGERSSEEFLGGDCYATPMPIGIAWRLNGPPHGWCIAEGVAPLKKTGSSR